MKLKRNKARFRGTMKQTDNKYRKARQKNEAEWKRFKKKAGIGKGGI